MSTIRTDGDLIRIAKRMQKLRDELNDLAWEVRESEHPNRESFLLDLENNYLIPAAWPEHVVYGSLLHPERWETVRAGIRRKRDVYPLEAINKELLYVPLELPTYRTTLKAGSGTFILCSTGEELTIIHNGSQNYEGVYFTLREYKTIDPVPGTFSEQFHDGTVRLIVPRQDTYMLRITSFSYTTPKELVHG